MNLSFIQGALMEQMRKQSRLDQHRNYLGISHISDCPRKAVYEFIHGIAINEQSYRMAFAGYEHETSILAMLIAAGLIERVNVEVIAPFDTRLKGHADAVNANDLIEIKSVSTSKFLQIVSTRRALRKHFIQVQLYMRYGGWRMAYIIYRCRETYEHFIVRVPYHSDQAVEFEERARVMLACIDRQELPKCECGKCQS